MYAYKNISNLLESHFRRPLEYIFELIHLDLLEKGQGIVIAV